MYIYTYIYVYIYTYIYPPKLLEIHLPTAIGPDGSGYIWLYPFRTLSNLKQGQTRLNDGPNPLCQFLQYNAQRREYQRGNLHLFWD